MAIDKLFEIDKDFIYQKVESFRERLRKGSL